MAHYASARALKFKIERCPSKNAHTCASLLADLFREPDLEFGSFSVIFEKDNADPKSSVILRVTFTEPRKKSHEGSKADMMHSKKLLFQQLQSHFNEKQQIHVYTLLSRQQALELREVRGGDDMRLHYLSEKLGIKLVGRKGLGPTADAVIASIKAERGSRKTASPTVAVKSEELLRPKGASEKRKMIRRAKVIRNGSVPVSSNAGGNNGLMLHPRGEGSNGLSTPVKIVACEHSPMSSEATGSVNALTSSEAAGFDYALLPSVNTNMDVEANITASRSLAMSFDKISGNNIGSSEFS